MNSRTRGFLAYRRREPDYRPVTERLKDYRAVELPLSEEDVREQAARCMDCGTPFCHGCGCPLSNVIPELNDHVLHGRWQAALDLLLQTNPFPEFTGRICPAPCEAACVAGIHDGAVTIRRLELAIVEAGFQKGFVVARPPRERRDERVAVIGSGPAGLAAADALNRSGFRVVVYEMAARAGGILRYGIPDFKLEKSVLDRRLRLMEEEGVVFETGVEIGRDLSHRYLRTRFDAVLLTGGAREPRDLAVPGRELSGIHFAMPFLIQQNRRVGGEPLAGEEEILAHDRKVVILGGGDTGADCLGTALRQGARSVLQIEILPKPPAERPDHTPWPGWPDLLRHSSSHREGGERRWSIRTEAFTGRAGRLTGLRCAEVEWRRANGVARPQPVRKPGTEFAVEADLVLLALGFTGPGRNPLVEQLGLALDARGFLRRDERCRTSEPGVFAAGDMSCGASLVVRAIADGRNAARHVRDYLQTRRETEPRPAHAGPSSPAPGS